MPKPLVAMTGMTLACIGANYGAWASPYETTDVSVADRYEIKTIVSHSSYGPEEEVEGPLLDFTIPVSDRLEVSAAWGPEWSRENPQDDWRRSLGDLELAAKYQVLPIGTGPIDLTVEPQLVLPTSSSDHGAWRVVLPAYVAHKFGPVTVTANAAYSPGFSGADDIFSTSGLVTYEVSDRLEIGVEIANERALNHEMERSTVTNVGFKFGITPALELQVAVGRTLYRSEGNGGAQAELAIEYQF